MTQIKVEDLLNEVDYGEEGDYEPTQFAIEFIEFIKLVNGTEGESHKSPVVHYRMLDNLIEDNGKDTINMCHRGMAKTTLLGEYLFLYLAVFGRLPNFGQVDLAIYVSDSIENGVKNMRKNLEFRWENSEFLRKYIPNTRFTDVRYEFTNIDGKKFIVKGYGAKTGVRGAKEMGIRPQLAVLDDLVSDEDARSATVIESIEATVNKAVEYALDPTSKKVVWSGTPFNAKDPLYKAVESGAYNVNVYPVCKQFPCTKEEFEGSWEDRFSYEYVSKQYEKAKMSGMADTFNQELMLRIMSDDDRLIQNSEVKWYNRTNLIRNIGNLNIYITTDFATSEKTASDFSVISVWGLNSNNDWFWLDGICKRQLMDANINDLFYLARKYQPMNVGVEVSGQQGGFIPWIQKEMMDRNCYFNLASENNSNAPGIRPTTNKMQRFNVVVPWFKAGKMYFPEDMKQSAPMRQAMDEISLVSPSGFKSKHDDFSDTISMLPLMHTFAPGAGVAMVQDDNGLWGEEDDYDEDLSYQSYLV